MNRRYATDPNILATIHCGGQRLTRNSQCPLPSSLEAPTSDSSREPAASLNDQVTVPRWKREA